MPTITFEKRYQIWKMAASLDDGRPVLSHVLVEPQGVMVASNGNALAVVPCEITWFPDEERRNLVIPASLFQLAAKATTKKDQEACLSVTKEGASVTLRDYRAVGSLWTDTDFPNWRKQFPYTVQAVLEHQSIGSKLVSDMSLALGTTCLTYIFTGLEKPILVLPLDSHGVGCIMPMRYTGDYEPRNVLERRLSQWVEAKP